MTSLLAKMVGALRRPPWLTGLAATVGAVVFAVLLERLLRDASVEAKVGGHLQYALKPDARAAARVALLGQVVRLAVLCFLPALFLAVIRLRGRAVVLPVFLVSTFLGAWFITRDVAQNWEGVMLDPLGLIPSPRAYWVKLGLIGGLALSIPILVALYTNASLLDRYVVRSFCMPFLLCLSGTGGIWIIMDLLNNTADFARSGMGAVEVMWYYLGQSPRILVVLTEAALLLATLYCVGRLSRHNELISMVTSGRSIPRVLLPLFIIGAWAAGAMVALNYQLAPSSDQRKAEVLKEKDAGAAANILFRNREDRRLWLIGRMPDNPALNNRMDDVILVQQNDEGKPEHFIAARHAKWNPVSKGWRFDDVRHYAYRDETGKRVDHPLPVVLDKLEFHQDEKTGKPWVETPGAIMANKRDPESMGVPELRSYLMTNQGRLPELSLAPYTVAEQWRYALPLRCLLMVLIAAPLGIVASRRSMLGGVTVAVGVFLFAYFAGSVLLSYAGGGHLPPVLGAWLLNAVCLVTGLFALWLRSGNRSLASLNPFRTRNLA